MKKKQEQAKFFCESCGKEVKQNAKVCNYCGKFFSSVRCPNCGKTGSTSEFENGCPDCGYAVNKGFKNINSKSNFQNHKKSSLLASIFNNRSKLQSKSSDSLPLWIYLVCIFALILVLICFYSCLQ